MFFQRLVPLPALAKVLAALGLLVAAAGCAQNLPTPPETPETASQTAPEYVIGPLDQLEIFVWRSPDLSTSVPVRPDGLISMPLIDKVQAAGKTPTALADDLETSLKPYVKEPRVTVIVRNFSGQLDQKVRVVGAAQEPVSVPYQANMTVLDVMIQVGGLTEFAAGNRAVLIRGRGESQKTYRLRLNDLLRDGNIGANAVVLPGDVILIPQTWL